MYIFPKLRPFQLDTLERIKSSTHKFIILHMPTGSGKSFFPAQLAFESYKTLALVATKSLQAQYLNGYNMASITGKSNYPCLNSPEQLTFLGQQEIINAETCHLPKSAYKEKCLPNCPYPLARQEFIESIGAVTNYSKFLLDRMLIDQFEPEYLFCDEAHLLSDIVVDFAGLQFKWKSKEFKKYGQPFYTNDPQPVAFNQVREWLSILLDNMKQSKPLHPEKGGNIRSYLWHKRHIQAISNTLYFMQNEPSSWYIESDREGLRIRPLTARFNFLNLFDRAEKVILMSATIDRHTLRELGINDYEFISTPNPFPPPLRPIVDLKAPRIGYNSKEAQRIKQAQIIAQVLNSRPEYHTGLIHVSSKNMAYNLAERLSQFTNRKLYVPDRDIGTEEVSEIWDSQIDNGTIGIFWQVWEGLDAGKDSINIIAKVPFTDFSEGFDKARFMYDGKAGYSRTAAKMVQGLGRIRRGNVKDYGNNKFVGIADGNWTRLRKYISKDILESIK